MKTRLIIEIETPDTLPIWEDAEKGEEDYTEEELEKFRDTYCKELHEHILSAFDLDKIEEWCFENIEELQVEEWYEFKDYGIKISVKKESTKNDN